MRYYIGIFKLYNVFFSRIFFIFKEKKKNRVLFLCAIQASARAFVRILKLILSVQCMCIVYIPSDYYTNNATI